jgi:RNA polymerase sigma-70 factor (ECF subfamily)
MPADDPNLLSFPQGAGHFATTHWSVVLAAGQGASPDSRKALASLCETYWYPLYAFVRRQGYSADDAQDVTQDFFATLLEKQYLRVADSERGKFRSFLLTAFKHFLSKERAKAHAEKRGGGRKSLSLDFRNGESRYDREPAHAVTAETLYERRWALTLLDQVLGRLEAEYTGTGKQELFGRLKEFLIGERGARTYAQVAADLGVSEGAVKVAVHRLRQRYRELIRAEIAQTLADPNEVEDELQQLFAAVRFQKS